MKNKRFSLAAETAAKGTRLDKYLKKKYPGLKRKDIKESIKAGYVLVNDSNVRPDRALEENDKIEGLVKPASSILIAPNEDLDLDVQFENDEFLIINKPAGLSSTPDRLHKKNSLISALLGRYPKLSKEFAGVAYLGLVHRLDKRASGLIITAKTLQAFKALCKLMKDGGVQKKYLVIAQGDFESDLGTIDTPLRKVKEGFLVRTVASEAAEKGSKRSVSIYRVLKRLRGAAYLEVEIKTGRTHQIRAHLSSIGHPVIGDVFYGFDKKAFPREYRLEKNEIFLHACSLAFEYGNVSHYFKCEAPSRFGRLMSALES
ncbi:MAG: RluA family pseudouridine synthase [Candidatus Margulisiibacteriota bacterium]